MTERMIAPSKLVAPILMNSTEIEVLRRFSCRTNLQNIEPLKVAEVLRRGCIINEFDIEELREKHKTNSKTEVSILLLQKIKTGGSLRDIITILFSNGHTKLAEDMSFEFTICLREDYISRVHRPDLSDRAKTSDRFRTIKSQVHALVFENGYAFLKELCRKKRKKIKEEQDEIKRMKLYDELVALKAAEMDAVTNIQGIVSHNHKGYIEIQGMVDLSSNPALTRVLLHGRIADVLSTVSSFDAAKNHIREAYTSAYASGPCIEVTDMMYKHVVIKLSEFENYPSIEALNAVLREANIALWTLQDQKEENRIFYSKLLLLRMTFAHLGIGKFCKMVNGYIPNMESLVQAEKLLKHHDLDDLEHRRQMFLEIAKARLFQWKGEMDAALCHLVEARKLADEGQYAENEGLKEYEHQLKTNPWNASTYHGDGNHSSEPFQPLNSFSDDEVCSGEFGTEFELVNFKRPIA